MNREIRVLTSFAFGKGMESKPLGFIVETYKPPVFGKDNASAADIQ